MVLLNDLHRKHGGEFRLLEVKQDSETLRPSVRVLSRPTQTMRDSAWTGKTTQHEDVSDVQAKGRR